MAVEMVLRQLRDQGEARVADRDVMRVVREWLERRGVPYRVRGSRIVLEG